MQASLLGFTIEMLVRITREQGMPLAKAQTHCLVISLRGQHVIFIKCVRHITREQLIQPMMVMRSLLFDMRCQVFSMLLGAATMDPDQKLLNKLLCGIFHVRPGVAIGKTRFLFSIELWNLRFCLASCSST